MVGSIFDEKSVFKTMRRHFTASATDVKFNALALT